MFSCAMSEFLQLPSLPRAERCTGMFEHLRNAGRWNGFHGQHSLIYVPGRALLHFFPVLLVPELLPCHVALKAQNRVTCLPGRHFIGGAVAAGIIGRGMIPYPVGDTFDESRSSSVAG